MHAIFSSVGVWLRLKRQCCGSTLSVLLCPWHTGHSLTRKVGTPEKKIINSALVKGGASGNKLAHFVSHALRQPADPLLKNPKDLAHPARSRGIFALDPVVLGHCKPRYTSPWAPSSSHLSSPSPSKDSTPLVAHWGLDHARGESCRRSWLNHAERSPGY